VHGFLHLLLMQAFECEQSEFCTHSGLQLTYGSPTYSGGQVQEPAPLLSLQIAFNPQGDGLQGRFGVSAIIARKLKKPY
jgi:hypothetical protein